MSNIERTSPAPRALFLGMMGSFSPPALLSLLHNEIDVCAVVLPARDQQPAHSAIRLLEPPAHPRSLLPVLHSSLHTSIARIAWKRHIPLWEVARMSDAETLNLFAHFQADIMCVACFSLYIPRTILDIPRLGCLNVHPSVLPANRGPDPLFWTFHEGSQETGVTIHVMDEGLDTGPIVAQQKIEVPDGIRYAQLEAQCAELGGQLLARSIWQRYQGNAILTPQDESKSSYLPLPGSDDYQVQASEWEARRVYNFIKGVASRDEPITLISEGRSIQIVDAISYSHEDINSDAYLEEKNSANAYRIRCRDGWVLVS